MHLPLSLLITFFAYIDHRIFILFLSKIQTAIHKISQSSKMPSQTPEEMFADKSYDGWERLTPHQKVERMFSIHKSGHEQGEDVSFTVPFFFFCSHVQVRKERHVCSMLVTGSHKRPTNPLFLNSFLSHSRHLVLCKEKKKKKQYTANHLFGLCDINSYTSSASVQTSTKASSSSPSPHLPRQPLS